MNINSCKIIAIEGIDGSGKTIQHELLTKKLVEKGKMCLSLSFPVYEGFFGSNIGKMLSGKSNPNAMELDAKSMSLWYSMDRWNCFKKLDFSQYDYLLLNRYTLSNIVYQSIRLPEDEREEFANWLIELETKILELPTPDMYLIMDIDEHLSNVNVKNKGFRDYVGSSRDVYESSESLMKLAKNSYIKYSKKLDNSNIIICSEDNKMKPITNIHEEICALLKKNNLL